MTGPAADRNVVTASVDIGGTFTDVVIQRGRRVVSAFKVPTTSTRPEVGVLAALRGWSGEPVDELVHATTLATNTLLSRQVPRWGRAGLVTTRGFGDVIEIGRQNRSELYNLQFERPPPLVPAARRYELEDRVLSDGVPTARVRTRDLQRLGARLQRDRVRSVAISFLHSYRHPENERRVARFLRQRFEYVSVSSEIAPEPREYERTSTTVLNAVLMPVVSEYIGRLARGLGGPPRPRVSVMSSSGGLISVDEVYRRPVQTIESGPAAGVIASAALARAIGIARAISFDMGGTTAKAGTITDGLVETTSELEVGGTAHHGRKTKGSGYPVRFPFVDLVEVSAGGGTILSTDAGGGLTVGPGSAGSDPGPACYGLGGTRPTLTDANLVAGVLGGQMLGGRLTLDPVAARRSFRGLGDPPEVAEAALRLADLEMSRAIRMVTVERGLDPSGFTLIAFGGAGPQHAANVARELGVRRVVVPPRPGLFSALGLLHSDGRFEERASFPEDPVREFRRLERKLSTRLRPTAFLRTADCRYSGQGSELTVRVRDAHRSAITEEFERVHRAAFGFRLRRDVEIVTLRAFAIHHRAKPSMRPAPRGRLVVGRRPARIEGRTEPIRTFNRDGLALGVTVVGPACVEDYDSTIFLPPGWRGAPGRFGEFRMRGSAA